MKDIRLEPKLIGSLNLTSEELVFEDCIGRINFPKGVGECSIYVYSGEGTIPHFHIIPKSKIGESCICIYQPLYFNHDFKQMKLNSKQRKELNNWLKETTLINPKITNWELISALWQTGNGTKYVPKNPVQPNYVNMENMRN